MNAFFGTTLDLSDIASPSFEPIPAGNYLAVCSEFVVEDKVTDKGAIKQANCRFQILEGPHANRVVFQNISILHHSDKAQSYGQGMLVSWCDALDVDKTSLESGDALTNRPVGIKVKISPAREWNGKMYDARNEVQTFMSSDVVNGTSGFAPAAPIKKTAKLAVARKEAAPAPAPATATGAAKMPWSK
jgi:hypothetical protein